MNLRRLQRHWNKFAQRNARWAVLTEKRDWTSEEFFETGRAEISRVMKSLDSLGVDVPRGKALDFGCGPGRITTALADHFHEVDGVDIAPSMIELAKRHNRHEDRVTYHLNASHGLNLFEDGTFDFIYSALVLQHMAPRYSKGYLREFLRVLKPGGWLVFQLTVERIPDEGDGRARGLKRILTKTLPRPPRDPYREIPHRRPRMEMHGVPIDETVALLEEGGGAVLDVHENDRIPGWLSARYVVTKR